VSFVNFIESLEGHVAEHLSLLTPVDQIWQPTDYLPDLTGEDWSERLGEFREAARALPDELLVVLVGNMVTEEALPNYAVSLEHIARDPTGAGEDPWACWLRGWTAEENRHGDLLNAYLRLTGRVDMRAVEVTIHHLIRNGFAPGHESHPYEGLIYASFQERATRITHGNVAKRAAERGEENLARICRKIAADETRHEMFYTRIVAELFERDPETTLMCYRAVLKRLVTMPGARMHDGHDPDVFQKFGQVVQATGVYTSRDYASVIRHLNRAWGLETRSYDGKAAKVQEYLCNQPVRYERLADEREGTATPPPAASFAWVRSRAPGS